MSKSYFTNVTKHISTIDIFQGMIRLFLGPFFVFIVLRGLRKGNCLSVIWEIL